jgi:T5orf172 domain
MTDHQGYVYILSNPSMPGLLKIGITTDTIDIRGSNLYTTGVPEPFKLEAWYWASSASHVEKRIHKILHAVRPNLEREFFRISFDDAIKILKDNLPDITWNMESRVLDTKPTIWLSKFKEELNLLSKEVVDFEICAESHKWFTHDKYCEEAFWNRENFDREIKQGIQMLHCGLASRQHMCDSADKSYLKTEDKFARNCLKKLRSEFDTVWKHKLQQI